MKIMNRGDEQVDRGGEGEGGRGGTTRKSRDALVALRFRREWPH